MSSPSGYLSGIFQSIQGEGVHVGERQVFVRMIGCNLTCAYCDEGGVQLVSEKDGSPKKCRVAADKKIDFIENPVTAEKAAGAINGLLTRKELFHSVSLTGGEPLLQVDFLKALLPLINHKKYLETNGVLYENLKEIIFDVDIIAMDIKLPSATKGEAHFEEHRRFIRTAKEKSLFIKAVFSKDTAAKEIDDISSLLLEEGKAIPLVLQPVSSSRNYRSSPTPEQCLAFHAIAKRKLDRVLVIPQTHKILGMD